MNASRHCQGACKYLRLQAAYIAEGERQMRRIRHDIEVTKATAGADHAAVVEIETLVGEDKGEDK